MSRQINKKQNNRVLRDFIQLTRPLNVFLTLITVVLAGVLAGAQGNEYLLWIAAVAAGLIDAGGNMMNDWLDVAVDRINKPQRPLASGRISLRTAKNWVFALWLLGAGLAFVVKLQTFLIALLVIFLLALYNARLKSTVLWGNLVVSFLSALPFIYGALAIGKLRGGWLPAGFAFLFHLGREIIKDWQDAEGDVANNVATFANSFSENTVKIFVDFVFGLLIIFTLYPYLQGWFNFSYLLVLLLFIYPVLVGVAVAIWFKSDKIFLGKISHLLKLDMIMGLIALYVGTRHVVFFN